MTKRVIGPIYVDGVKYNSQAEVCAQFGLDRVALSSSIKIHQPGVKFSYKGHEICFLLAIKSKRHPALLNRAKNASTAFGLGKDVRAEYESDTLAFICDADRAIYEEMYERYAKLLCRVATLERNTEKMKRQLEKMSNAPIQN